MKEHRELQPSNEQIVASCQLAGIRSVYVDTPGVLFYTDDDGVHDIHPHRDSCEGSALFIVAVLGALPIFEGETLVRRFCDEWFVRGHCALTLTAACMAAIVGAYPEQETTT